MFTVTAVKSNQNRTFTRLHLDSVVVKGIESLGFLTVLFVTVLC